MYCPQYFSLPQMWDQESDVADCPYMHDFQECTKNYIFAFVFYCFGVFLLIFSTTKLMLICFFLLNLCVSFSQNGLQQSCIQYVEFQIECFI